MCGVLFWFFQGFPNSCKGWEEWKTLLGRGGFFIRWWEPEEKWFRPFEPFPKLETTFCKNWTSTKIKISMICVYKEYKVKIKMALEQWLQLKNMFLLGYSMKNSGGMEERVFDLWWGGLKIWLGGESTGCGVGDEKLFCGWGDSVIPLVGKILPCVLWWFCVFYSISAVKWSWSLFCKRHYDNQES